MFDFGYVGINAKYARSKLEDYSYSALGIDIGYLKEMTFLAPKKSYIGASIKNIGVSDVRMPMDLVLGSCLEVISDLMLAGDLVLQDVKDPKFNLGIEYNINNMIYLRAGYKIGYDVAGFGAGIGLNQKLGSIKSSLNYAFAPNGDFGLNHYVGINLQFPPAQPKEEDNKLKIKTEEDKEETIKETIKGLEEDLPDDRPDSQPEDSEIKSEVKSDEEPEEQPEKQPEEESDEDLLQSLEDEVVE